jgi:hypothetical protein
MAAVALEMDDIDTQLEYSSPCAAPWPQVNGKDNNAAFLRVVAGVAEITSLLPDIVESKRRTHEELLAADNVLPEKICLTPESYFFPEHQPAQEHQFGELVGFEDAMMIFVPVEQVFFMPVMVCCEENYCYSSTEWWWLQ